MGSRPNPFLKEPKAKPNPFIKKGKPKPPPRPLPQPKGGHNARLVKPPGAAGKKPKGPPRMSEAEWAAKRADAQRMVHDLNLQPGDRVIVTWELDRAFGSGTASYTGTITELDDWIRCENGANGTGYLHMPLTGVAHVSIVKDVPTTPKKVNPFMKGKQ